MLGLKKGGENVGKKFLVLSEHKGGKNWSLQMWQKHQRLIKLLLLA